LSAMAVMVAGPKTDRKMIIFEKKPGNGLRTCFKGEKNFIVYSRRAGMVQQKPPRVTREAKYLQLSNPSC